MKKTIVCFGDSNTYGYDAVNRVRFNLGTRWTRVLADLLQDNYYVVEEGLGGRTIAFDDSNEDGLNAMTYMVPMLKSHLPIDLLIIMLGTNDCKERFKASAEDIARNMKNMISKVRSVDSSVKILLVAPIIIGSDIHKSEVAKEMGKDCDVKSRRLIPLYKELAVEENIQFINSNDFAIANEKDFMHISQDSQGKLAVALRNKIIEMNI